MLSISYQRMDSGRSRKIPLTVEEEKQEKWSAMHRKTADETSRISSSEIGRAFVSEQLLSLSSARSMRRYLLTTSHPSSTESAIRMSLFL